MLWFLLHLKAAEEQLSFFLEQYPSLAVANIFGDCDHFEVRKPFSNIFCVNHYAFLNSSI